MARQLVDAVLVIQLQQLKENGLDSHQMYGEIELMRKHLDVLIDAEMPQVVQMLVKLETDKDAGREELFQQAREKSRQIVVSLLVERQALLRRLRVAEMAAQVRQLIQLETGVLTTTVLLPDQPAQRRETMNLATIEDQRDVGAMYLRFKETLKEVSEWAGPFGMEAGRGMLLLQEGKVDQELVNSENHLRAGVFPDAANSQRTVIRGLQALLARIEMAQGLADADRSEAADRIREMIDQQEKVREATRQTPMDQAQLDQLVQQQTDIGKQIAQMNEAMQNAPEIQKSLQKAQQSASEAASNLFEQNQPEALTDQGNVLENLQEAAEEALQLDAFDPAGMTADEYQEQIEDLQAARQDLAKVEEQQAQATAKVESEPPAAAPHEQQASQQLAEIPKNRDLPEPVDSALAEAQQATAEAASQPNPESVEEASEAVEQAVSETEVALADAQREQLAEKIRELAYAAAALDVAAQAERNIAQESGEAAAEQGLDAAQAAEMGDLQDAVGQIAEKVAEGVQNTAPEAAQTLEQAKPPIDQAGQQLAAAEQSPGDASKPAAQERLAAGRRGR